MPMIKAESGTITEPKQSEKTKLSPPKMFKVLLLNDDYTSMDFVVSILETVFKRTPSEAVRIMLMVHNSGSGVAGVYTRQIAESKVSLVHQRARTEGFPLLCSIEELD
jgi:ATP-dependent Clp protease adaptor protein ClpS